MANEVVWRKNLSDGKTYCAVCAWRADCQKKLAFQSSGSYRCPDYTRDLTLKDDEDEEDGGR